MNLRRAQQFALERGITACSLIASIEALRPLDPALRWLAVRRLRRLIARAERETALREPDHVLRVAYLLGARADIADADQPERVRAAYAAVPAPTALGPRARWFSPSLLGVCACLVAMGVFMQRVLRPFKPQETPAGQLLGAELTRGVVAVSKANAAELGAARDVLTGPRAQKVLGADVVRELSGVLNNMSMLRVAEPASARPLLDAYLAGVTRLDHALERAAQPFFVDGELRSSESEILPLPMSYYVQREVRVTDGASSERALWLWRLDTLNVHQGVLGFTRPNTPAALVLLDQLETDLIRYILPGAAPSGAVELVDELTRDKSEPWALDVEARAAELVRGYYRALPGPLGADAVRIGTLLSRRRELVRKWQAALRGQGIELAVPTRLFPETDYAAELELRITRSELEQWDDLQAELRERVSAFEAVRDRFARGVERHEIQHRLDYSRGLIAVPPFLCRVLGLDSPIAESPTALAARARDEASAYLAELARSEDSPMLELVLLSHFMLDREQLGTPYTYAALQVYATVGGALGLDLDEMLGHGAVSRPAFARLALAIWARPPAEVTAAAARGYRADYAAELPVVRIVASKDSPRYRP